MLRGAFAKRPEEDDPKYSAVEQSILSITEISGGSMVWRTTRVERREKKGAAVKSERTEREGGE